MPRRSTLVDRIAQVPFEPKGGESMLKAKNELIGPNEDLSSAVPMLGTRRSIKATFINARSERSFWVTDDVRDFVRNRRPSSPVTNQQVYHQRMKQCRLKSTPRTSVRVWTEGGDPYWSQYDPPTGLDGETGSTLNSYSASKI